MPGYLISPSEPPLLKTLGTVSTVPESHGADVVFATKVFGVVGIQRKEISDLINSIQNGMLAKEISKMDRLGLRVLVVEGRPRWTPGGELLHSFTRFSRIQYRSFLRSVQLRGIMVEFSDDQADTVALIESLKKWAEKPEHHSLDRRPKPKATAGNWGQITHEEWCVHLLQSVDGIGPTQAKAIYEHFGGRVPIILTATEKELLGIKGLGKKRVQALIAAFGGTASTTK